MTQSGQITEKVQIAERVKINGKLPATGEHTSSFRHAWSATGERSVLSEWISPPRIGEGDEVQLEPPPARQTTLAGLYNLEEVHSPSLRSGINLLDESIDVLEQAKDAVEENDELMAQDAVTRLRPVLTELFICRDLGDGFAEIVRACQTAARNLGDNTPSLDQVVELKWALNRLRKEPFISFEDAIVLVMGLDNSDLVVDEASITEIVPAPDE